MTINRSKFKSKVEFQYSSRFFQTPKVVISQPQIEIPYQNLVSKLFKTF